MRESGPSKDKLFRAFKRGDPSSLLELLEGEREGLYDYLLRMTGQMSRSYETIDEVYQSLTEETLETVQTYGELKICLYTTARKFNADIWNADTGKLANAAIDERFAPLDRAFRALAGPEREALLLKLRGGFSFDEAGEILTASADVAESLYEVGLNRLADVVLGDAAAPLRQMQMHPLPPRSSHATVNLSMVMQGIKTKPVGLRSPTRLTFLGLLILLAGVWFFEPQLLTKAAELLHGLVQWVMGL